MMLKLSTGMTGELLCVNTNKHAGFTKALSPALYNAICDLAPDNPYWPHGPALTFALFVFDCFDETGFYAGIFLVAPRLAYKIFFRGGVLPGTSKAENAPEEPTEVGLQKLRWFAFALGASEAYKMALTDNLTKQQKKALNVDALVWLTAAAFHVEPFVKKTQPKEICLQQFLAMPLTALACFLAAKKL